MGTTHHTARSVRRRGALVAAAGLMATLTACTGGADHAGANPSAGLGSSTSSSSSSGVGSTASRPGPSASPDGVGSSGSSGSSSSAGGSSASGAAPSAAGLPTCTASRMRTRVEAQPGGGAAGSVVVQVLATNTSSSVCVTHGYPGVSLTAPDSGKQLGAAADREPGQPEPTMRLEPGKTAVALVKVAQAGDFGSRCSMTKAAGFRVYLPGDKAAEFAPFVVDACATSTVHQLSVRPFNT